jgi:hypothetical protein
MTNKPGISPVNIVPKRIIYENANPFENRIKSNTSTEKLTAKPNIGPSINPEKINIVSKKVILTKGVVKLKTLKTTPILVKTAANEMLKIKRCDLDIIKDLRIIKLQKPTSKNINI